MKNMTITNWSIDYLEIYTPLAKSLAYWHTHALGFNCIAKAEFNDRNVVSYLLQSNEIRIVLTTAYPTATKSSDPEVNSFISTSYCGVKRFAIHVDSVKDSFEYSVANGAAPVKYPVTSVDQDGEVDEATIKLYDNSEIAFINRARYNGIFKPGFRAVLSKEQEEKATFRSIDHIAGEVRINECAYWTQYLAKTIGTTMVQSIVSGPENKTGMILNINQSPDERLTLVIAEPQTYLHTSKVQQNIQNFGPGIHHVAFLCDDLIATTKLLLSRDVEFVSFPGSYYQLLRTDKEFEQFDIDTLEQYGILVDKEEDTYLFQKFIKPITDRPFFIYEIVQRVNGYNGFALKNINVLKKAEEMEIMK